ncbi:unnamed protein product [Bathycoccus prasinos]|mmetsp:Transcript_5440/g.18419  ORF Transcript_5440/g.18419 Transcript_5440/m.18419 type:complete len:641 (-) Transcript_5440:1744-3666(-)
MGGGGVNSENSDEEAWDALERRLDDPSSSNHPTTTTTRTSIAATTTTRSSRGTDHHLKSSSKTISDDDEGGGKGLKKKEERRRKGRADDREDEKKTTSSINEREFSGDDEDDDDGHGRGGKKRATSASDEKRGRRGGRESEEDGKRLDRRGSSRDRSRERERGSGGGGGGSRGEKRQRHRSRSRDYRDNGRRGGGSGRGRDRERDDSRDRSNNKPRETSAEREANRRRKKEERRAMEEKRALEKIDRDTRTCFAYNLSTKSDERDIFKFFMKAGEVTDVRIIYDRNRPISKGMAYVEFQDKSSIPKALELTGETLRGQKVMVKHSEAEKNIAWEAEQAAKGVTGKGKRGNGDGTQQSGPCALFVAGLHEGLAEEDVKAVFEPFGALDAIEISRDGNGQSNGHGIVQYREWSHAMLAVSQLNGLELVGQALKISVAAGQGGAKNDNKNRNNDRSGGGDVGGGGGGEEDDDDRVGGQMDDTATYAKMDAAKRAELMQKLAGGDATTIGAIPTATLTHNAVKIKTKEEEKRELIMMTQGFFGPSSPIPTKCVLLKNLFDPAEETDEEWWLDIEEDVKGEVSKYGECVHAHVDKENPYGFCYLKFDDVEAAKKAQFGLNNRWFAGRSIICDFQFVEPYNKHFKL